MAVRSVGGRAFDMQNMYSRPNQSSFVVGDDHIRRPRTAVANPMAPVQQQPSSAPANRVQGGVDRGQHAGWTPRPVSLADPSTWMQWPSNVGPIDQTNNWADSVDQGIQSGSYMSMSPTPVRPPNQIMGARAMADMPRGNPMARGSAAEPQYDPQGGGPAAAPRYNPQAQAAYEGPTNPMRQGAMLGSSNQAGLRAGNIPWDGRPVSPEMQHGAVAEANGYNGYVADVNDPNRMSPAQKYAAAQQGAQQMGQNDPTNMSGRFEAGSALGAQAAAIQQGQTGVAAGTHYKIPGGYGEMPTYRPIGASPEVMLRPTGGGNNVSYIPPGNDEVLNRQNAGLHNQVANPERGANRRARREAETQRRSDVKFKHMVSQGMNPMGPKAKGMFPAQVAKMQGQQAGGLQNPMDVFKPKGVVTPGGQAAAQSFMESAAAGNTDPTGRVNPPNPFIAGTGVTGTEDNIETLHFGIQNQLQRGVAPSPEDLKVLHGYVSAFDTKHRKPGYDPFDMTYGWELTDVDQKHTATFGPAYKDLSSMKNPTDKQLSDWWAGFASQMRPTAPGWGERAAAGVGWAAEHANPAAWLGSMMFGNGSQVSATGDSYPVAPSPVQGGNPMDTEAQRKARAADSLRRNPPRAGA